MGDLNPCWQATCPSMSTFWESIPSTLEFAKIDPGRFRSRDQMRAEAISPVAGRYRSVYIEAGQMHAGLAQARSAIRPGR